jgi:hypothetical protein
MPWLNMVAHLYTATSPNKTNTPIPKTLQKHLLGPLDFGDEDVVESPEHCHTPPSNQAALHRISNAKSATSEAEVGQGMKPYLTGHHLLTNIL